jgi:hypothetical protein
MSLKEKQKILRVVLYVLLLLSAATSLWGGEHLWEAARLGDVGVWVPLLAPVIFTVFCVLYALDRWLLLRRGHTSLLRAMIQCGVALLFVALLWPAHQERYREIRKINRAEHSAYRLVEHPNPDVRSITCELLAFRKDSTSTKFIAARLRRESHPQVLAACNTALLSLNSGKPILKTGK